MTEPRCSECPLFKKRKRTFVPSVFAPQPNGLAIVGEQPWRDEASARTPFVGRSGKLLDQLLRRNGLERGQCHILNAFSCFTGPEISDAEKKRAMLACQPRLEAELRACTPSWILALGGTALKSLLRDSNAKITDYLGATVGAFPSRYALGESPATLAEAGSSAKREIPTLPSYHPAAILRSNTGCELAVLDAHIAKAAWWVQDNGLFPWGDAFTLAPSPAQLAGAMTEWSHGGTVAIDVETTDVNRFTCGLRTVGIGTWQRTVVIPWLPEEWGRFYTEVEWQQITGLLQQVLGSAGLRKVFHNKQFDIAVLERFVGPVAEPTEDTMVAHFVLHPLGNVLHGLAPAAGMYLNVPAWKKEHAGDYADEPLDELALYNSRDVRITFELWDEVAERIGVAGLGAAYKVQNDNALLALEMSRNGIPVDLHHWRASFRQWSEKTASQYNEALLASGMGEVQLRLYDKMIGSGARRLVDCKLEDYRSGAFDRTQVVILQDAVVHAAGEVLDNEDTKDLATSAEQLGEVLQSDESWKLWTARLDVDGGRKGPHVGKMVQRVRTAAKRLVKAVSRVPFFNLNGDREVGLVLHERLDIEVQAAPNKDGTYQTNEEALWHCQEHPFVKSWQNWKEADKQRKWLRDLPVYPDERIHPSYRTTRIPTTRFASGEGKTSPDRMTRLNAQNIEPRHLGMFVPRPGYGFVGSDFSTAELRVSSVLSGCVTMMDQFRAADAGADIKLHAQTARMIWPDEPEYKWTSGKLYTMAKRANFLTIYGGGSERLFAMMRETEDPEDNPALQAEADAKLRAQCEAVLRMHKRSYPEIHETARQWYYDCLKTGELLICHITGHRYYYPIKSKDYISPTVCANAPVQGTTATIAHLAGQKLCKHLPSDAHLLTYTHDFYLVECPIEMMADVGEIMRHCMHYFLNGPKGGLDIPADPICDWSWYSCK